MAARSFRLSSGWPRSKENWQNFRRQQNLTTHMLSPAAPVRMANRGLSLDEMEDLLPKSSTYRQASAVLFAQHSDVAGRPLTLLHRCHVGLLCMAGMLNGIFGEGETRHVAHWQSVKLVDRSEESEEEDGKTLSREKERF